MKTRVSIIINIVFLVFLQGCINNTEKSLETELLSIDFVNDLYIVKARTKTKLIKGFYSAPKFDNRDLLDIENVFYALETTGSLIKKEFFEIKGKGCLHIEEYNVHTEGMTKSIQFYRGKEGIVKSVVFEKNNEIYFKEEYDRIGVITNRELNFYLDVIVNDIDSTCVEVSIPGVEYLDCTYEFYADAHVSISETFILENITVDSIGGKGTLCFPTPKNDSIQIVGNFYFNCKKSDVKLFEFSEKIEL